MSDDLRKGPGGPTENPGSRDDLLVVGKVGKPKGVKGWARCRSFTDTPSDLAELYSTWRLKDHKGALTTWKVEDWRPGAEGDVLEVKLEGCDDRDLAMTLTNREILVSRSEFPEPEEEGSYYWVDIIGFTVRDAGTGEPLGVMTGVMEQPAADVIEVEPLVAPAETESGSSGAAESASSESGTESPASSESPESDNGSREAKEVAPSGAKGRGGARGKTAKPKKSGPAKILIPWVWGVFVLAVDMEARTIDVNWREGE